MRVPMPGPIGNLSRMDVVELLDGYLVSYTYTWGVWSGELQHPYQQVLRVDGQGQAREVARRVISIDLPSAYTNRNWWLSPVLRAICLGAQDLFRGERPAARQARGDAGAGAVAGGCVLPAVAARRGLADRQTGCIRRAAVGAGSCCVA